MVRQGLISLTIRCFFLLGLLLLTAACAYRGKVSNNTSNHSQSGLRTNNSIQVALNSEENLRSLTLQELMSIPVNPNLESFGIHQSADNEIDQDTVQFALFAPISEFPAYSAEIVVAAEMAIEQINLSGGVLGKRLVLLRADDKENTPVSAALAKQLAEEFNVSGFIGPSTSDSVIDVLEQVAIPHQIPLITQGASTMRLTAIAGDHPFWRMTTNNQQQVELITDFLTNQRQHKKILLITGRDLYSEEIAAGVKAHFEKIDNSMVEQLSISNLVYIDVMNLERDLANAQKKGVTAIVTTLVNQQVKGLMEKVKRHWKGAFPTIVIGDTVTPKYLMDAKLGKITACIFSYDGSHGGFSPEMNRRIESIIDTQATGIHGAYIFDAVMLQAMAKVVAERFNLPFKQAMEKITGNGKKISPDDYANIEALFKQYGELSYHGYSGRVHFSDKGDNLSAKQSMYSIGDKKLQESCL